MDDEVSPGAVATWYARRWRAYVDIDRFLDSTPAACVPDPLPLPVLTP